MMWLVVAITGIGVPAGLEALEDRIQEYVVAEPPLFVLQDQSQIQGHIVELTSTEALIRTTTGATAGVALRDLERVEFRLITGDRLSGKLSDWKSDGTYELKVEDGLVRVFGSTATAREEAGEPRDAAQGEVPVARPSDEGGPEADAELDTARLGPQLQIEVSANQAREDDTRVVFTIELSERLTESLVLVYATVDVTAKGGEDYEAQHGVLTLQPGTTTAHLYTPIIDDEVTEGDEQFRLFVSASPQQAEVKNRQVLATIQDDD